MLGFKHGSSPQLSSRSNFELLLSRKNSRRVPWTPMAANAGSPPDFLLHVHLHEGRRKSLSQLLSKEHCLWMPLLPIGNEIAQESGFSSREGEWVAQRNANRVIPCPLEEKSPEPHGP